MELARRGAEVTGLDPDPTIIATARNRVAAEASPVHFIEGRAESLPFADATFDCVLAVTVLCFVEDAERVVGEMARVLRPGGRLVIGELGRWSLWAALRRLRGWLGSPTWQSARFRSGSQLRALVGRAGLSGMTIRGAVFYPPTAFLARILAPIDATLGRVTTLGAAFIAVCAEKTQVS